MSVDGEILNVLRWQASGRDARASIPPDKVQVNEPFAGHRPPVVTRAEFRETGFTRAHLDRTRLTGYRVSSTLVTEVDHLLRRGEPFVYAYYEGIDKVAHEYGLGDFYDAELRNVDRIVADILEVLPPGAVLVVTSDHGQVDVGDRIITPAPEVMTHVDQQSGEGRFRWLHARPGHARHLLEAATDHHADTGWVVSVDQIVDERWLGPVVIDPARRMLGDVALVARDPVSYHDPADGGPFELIARHGSLTVDEMLVPLLVGARLSRRAVAHLHRRRGPRRSRRRSSGSATSSSRSGRSSPSTAPSATRGRWPSSRASRPAWPTCSTRSWLSRCS